MSIFKKEPDAYGAMIPSNGVMIQTKDTQPGAKACWTRLVSGTYTARGFKDVEGDGYTVLDVYEFNKFDGTYRQIWETDSIAEEVNALFSKFTRVAIHYYPGKSVHSIMGLKS